MNETDYQAWVKRGVLKAQRMARHAREAAGSALSVAVNGAQPQEGVTEIRISAGIDTWIITPGETGTIHVASADESALVTVYPIDNNEIELLNPASRGNG
jgi:hypothetical protein